MLDQLIAAVVDPISSTTAGPSASGSESGAVAASTSAYAAATVVQPSSATPSMDATTTAVVVVAAAAVAVASGTESIQQRLLNASDEEKENLFMALNAKYEITDVLPPPNHDDVQVLVMAVGYMLLFLLGTCGNVAVLTTIYQVVRSRRTTFVDNTLIYVVVLSCVDFGVCLSLPLTVIDQILGFWMFGSIVCKLHAVLENFGKILSALILTAMAFDRYAGVCHPQKKVLRSTTLAICILIGLAVYALVTLCPLLWSFTARELVLFEKETAPHKITRMRIEKCTMVNISSTVFTMFTVFLFVLCYLVPLFLVLFFYFKLIMKLRHHARQFRSSQIPLWRISFYTMAVAVFYFVCWTPFWMATAYAVYLEYAGEHGGTVPPMFVYFMYFIHALPFTNSAVNWILYGALNSQLQNRQRGGGGGGTSCGGGGGQTRGGGINEQNTTLLANGFTSTCQTLKTVPSLNGISSHRTTASDTYNHNNGNNNCCCGAGCNTITTSAPHNNNNHLGKNKNNGALHNINNNFGGANCCVQMSSLVNGKKPSPPQIGWKAEPSACLLPPYRHNRQGGRHSYPGQLLLTRPDPSTDNFGFFVVDGAAKVPDSDTAMTVAAVVALDDPSASTQTDDDEPIAVTATTPMNTVYDEGEPPLDEADEDERCTSKPATQPDDSDADYGAYCRRRSGDIADSNHRGRSATLLNVGGGVSPPLLGCFGGEDADDVDLLLRGDQEATFL